jgi:RES domain/HEPN/RES N-terminal domain 1
MSLESDIDQTNGKPICFKCVGETYLSQEIKKEGIRRRCSYCQKVAKSYLIEEMSERIDSVFEEHFSQTSDQPPYWQYVDKETEWERDGEPVIYAITNAAEIPEEAAEDIQRILEYQHSDFEADKLGEETPFSADSYYKEKGTNDTLWQEAWEHFERSLKTESRFFNRSATTHLQSVFAEIDLLKTADGKSLVVVAGPGTPLSFLFRARVFQSENKLLEALCHPDRHLGTPPSHHANAGRMNARGISVFYASNNPKVALAEVRPPVGSQVAVAKFEIIRPVRLLDLTSLSAVRTTGSIFDPTFTSRLERAMFLRSLSTRMTRAVMPDDEIFDYFATQAIADFLATDPVMKIDGIIFPSVQANGDALNVVLFHKSAKVADLDIPKGTEIDASNDWFIEEGSRPHYYVSEKVPEKFDDPIAEESWIPKNAKLPDLYFGIEHSDWDTREVTLNIFQDSISVHIVQTVEFKSDELKVHRHRSKKLPPNF